MTLAWAQRQAELLRDCIVSPDVFQHMVDRLHDFAVPYQQALETEASQRNVPLSLAGLLRPWSMSSAWSSKASSARRHGIITRWCACWLDKSSSSWGNPMASSPSIPAVFPNAAPTRWVSSASGVGTEAKSTTAR